MSLSISRHQTESIVIDDNITITVSKVHGGNVTLQIDAPKHVKILRSELVERPSRAEIIDNLLRRFWF